MRRDGAVTVVQPAFEADIYCRKCYGTIAGVLAAFVTVAAAAAPPSGGAAYDFFGAYDPLLWTFAGLSVVSARVALLVRADTNVPSIDPNGSGDARRAVEASAASIGEGPAIAGVGGGYQGITRGRR